MGRKFWEHYCHVERDVMGFEKGVPCDWCGMEEPIKVNIINDNVDGKKNDSDLHDRRFT